MQLDAMQRRDFLTTTAAAAAATTVAAAQQQQELEQRVWAHQQQMQRER